MAFLTLKRMRTYSLCAILGLGMAAALGGCGKAANEAKPQYELLETRWMLKQVDETPVMVSSFSYDYDSYIQLKRIDNRAVGLAACDAISARFALTTATKQLSLSQMGTMQSSCASPFLSNRYLSALAQTARYELEGNKLFLYDAQAAKPRLIFEAAQ
ncbi:META domain-containing protein [Hymenobacter arizonensis]|uniref:META domain-containing protein n=1 Tax=Hymenobacter arizonensis TaxID=1227077 RepID=A0A1I5US29_HYMAR|nr:META domain-containing protein [Hymenobacter arizonensis]SFP97978.1 META domain-containing protein [Hymenobacter arizonensis]